MIGRIGIIGAGQMGSGIAHVASLAGYPVRLLDANPQALAKAVETIDRGMQRQVARGKVTDEDRAAALGRISTASEMAAFSDCDVVIEAATENEQVKKEIF
ncbi:MAG: 3-hydroxyacyl-CoA dehydrogenase NAD-binding domain-containing protein [Alphaproteobacteria bacterium]